MCTVSVLRAPFADRPDDLRWRVVFNRDERLSRPPADGPGRHATESGYALFPRDPEGPGTWIAANDAGLVFALLNEPVEGSPEKSRSRGLVIPRIVGAQSLEEVEVRLGDVPAGRQRPFRLLVLSDGGGLEVVEYGGRRLQRLSPEPRLMRTSSSQAPHETSLRRGGLFDRLVVTPSAAAQDAFHRHRWAGDPSSSVFMQRPDACTVSTTVIDVFANAMRLTYRPWPAGTALVTELPRAA
jgi:hypothetical protein